MSDLRFLAVLLLSLLAPFVMCAFAPRAMPAARLRTCDEHLGFFRGRLAAPEDPGTVFLGTSATMNNVDADGIARLLAAGGDGRGVLDLGVNWPGLDVQAVLVEEWLARKRPRTVVLEVPLLYHYASHPNFDKVATPGVLLDQLRHVPWQAAAPVLALGPRLFCQCAAEALGGAAGESGTRGRHSGQLLVDLPAEEAARAETVAAAALAAEPATPGPESAARNLYRRWANARHAAALGRIGRLCREAGARLVLVSFPKLRLAAPEPALAREYRAAGEYHVIPRDLLRDPAFWRDQTHLRPAGARALAPWFADVLRAPAGP